MSDSPFTPQMDARVRRLMAECGYELTMQELVEERDKITELLRAGLARNHPQMAKATDGAIWMLVREAIKRRLMR